MNAAINEKLEALRTQLETNSSQPDPGQLPARLFRTKVADMTDAEVVAVARSAAHAWRDYSMASASSEFLSGNKLANMFEPAMQRIEDEGLLSSKEVAELWKLWNS